MGETLQVNPPKASSKEDWQPIIPLESLQYSPRKVKCPACKFVGKSAVTNILDNRRKAATWATLFCVLTCGLGGCMAWEVGQVANSEGRHATHFCEQCGLRLAYYYGDGHVVICAKQIYLENTSVKSWANSPVGPPPPSGAKLYDLVDLDTSQSTLRRKLKLRYGRGPFVEDVIDETSGRLVFHIPTPTLETKTYYEGAVFLPYDSDAAVKREHGYRGSNAPSRDAQTGIVSLYRKLGQSDLGAELTFHRSRWRIDVERHPLAKIHGGYGAAEQSSARTGNIAGDSNATFSYEVFFPFMSESGPLLWTAHRVDGTQRNIVALDMYNRIVAVFYEEDNSIAMFGSGEPSMRLVEEIAATFVAVIMQKLRVSDLGVAMSNRFQSD